MTEMTVQQGLTDVGEIFGLIKNCAAGQLPVVLLSVRPQI